eukprot:928512-Ditylum_brightwellii.AAC.1
MAPGIKAHLMADFDIVCKIQSLVSTRIPLKASWVEAPQDSTKPWEDLDTDVKLNCIADKDATTFRLTAAPTLQPVATPLPLPTNMANLVINRTTVTNNIAKIIRENANVSNIRQYVQCKTGLTNTCMDAAAWDDLGNTFA